jgi:hypothetical protein
MNIAERQAGALQGVLLLLPMTMAVMGLVVLAPQMLTLPALCVAEKLG